MSKGADVINQGHTATESVDVKAYWFSDISYYWFHCFDCGCSGGARWAETYFCECGHQFTGGGPYRLAPEEPA